MRKLSSLLALSVSIPTALAACGGGMQAASPSMMTADAGTQNVAPDGGGMQSDSGGGPTTVGAAGGSVTAADGKVTLTFPAGAVTQEIQIGAHPTTDANAIAGTAYELTPEGTLFAQPVTLSIAYDPAALPAGTDEAGLRLFTVGAGGLRVMVPDTVVDTARHAVSARVAHFSSWYIGPRPAAGLAVRFLSQTQTQVTVNGGYGVTRAHVGHCPPGQSCPGASTHFGCREEDFSTNPTVRPPESSVGCLYASSPPSCVAPPGGTITDDVSAPGFYCYRAGGEQVEVYSFGTLVAPPNAPADFMADPNNADGSVALSWTPIQSNLGDITGYYIVRNGGSGSKAVSVVGASRRSYVDADVLPSTMVSYVLYAFNDAGYSPPAMAMATTVMPVPGLPPAPTTLTASGVTSSSITLSWAAIAGASRYRVTRSAPAMSWDTTALTLTDSGLTASTTYTYMLAGVNDAGAGPTRQLQASTLGTTSPGCFTLRLSLSPASVDLFPGTSADVTVQIMRVDSGPMVTLSLSLPAGSPLVDLIDYSVTSPNPTTGNGTIHVQQRLQAVDAQGTLRVHATDGYGPGCDVDLSVHANI